MKTSKILFQSDKSSIEEIPKKVRASKLSKSILAIIMLSWILLLTSCIAFVPVGHEGHSGGHASGHANGHGGGHDGGHDEHHD